MKLTFYKTRRFRVGVSIIVMLAAFFIMTGQYRMVRFSKDKVLTVGVFSDNYWGIHYGYANKIVDDAISRFEKEHPDVQVRYESGIMKADYSEWLSEQMMNDTMPDVFFILGDDFSVFARIGALKDLDDLIKKDASFDPSEYYKTAYDSGNYSGSQCALPYECAPNMMFVNKTILDREQIAMPSGTGHGTTFMRSAGR